MTENEKFEQDILAMHREKATQPPRGDRGALHSAASDYQKFADQQVQKASNWYARRQSQGPMEFDHRDVLDALPDAFAIRAGLPLKQAPHPMAQWAAELPWPRLAEQLNIRRLGSSDFGAAMAVGYRQIVTSVYSIEDDCSPCFLDSVAGNFKPAEFPTIDTIDLQAVQKDGNGIGSIPLQILSTAAGEIGKVQNYRGRVLVSWELLLSDDFLAVTSIIRHLSAHAARLPAQQLGAILTANGNLADGQPLMGSGNTTTGTGYSVATLAEGAAKLRLVTSANNNVMNLMAAVWVVPPLGELQALATLRQVEVAGRDPIRVITNPWQPSGYSYLLCNPVQQPVFVRLLLDQPPLKPTVAMGNLPIQYDGVALDVDFSFGIQPVSRLGIVRIATA